MYFLVVKMLSRESSAPLSLTAAIPASLRQRATKALGMLQTDSEVARIPVCAQGDGCRGQRNKRDVDGANAHAWNAEHGTQCLVHTQAGHHFTLGQEGATDRCR